MHKSPCNNKECPMLVMRMSYCYDGEKPPCEEMGTEELWTLRNEIEEKNHDKGE